MDVTPNDRPKGVDFVPNDLGSLSIQVFIKQEISDEDTAIQMSISEYDELKSVKNEVKLEESEYASQDDTVQNVLSDLKNVHPSQISEKAKVAERNKMYRERQQLFKRSSCDSAESQRKSSQKKAKTKKPKTNAELCREYRQRQKIIRQLSQTESSTDQSVSVYDELKPIKDEMKLDEAEYVSLDNIYQNVLSDLEIDQSKSEYDELQTVKEKVKLEGSEYASLGDKVQNDLSDLNNDQPEKFLIIRGPNNERRYGCHLCGSFNTKYKYSLYRHIKLHKPEVMESYKCDLCSFETFYRRHMDVHVKVVHRSEKHEKLYKCDQCSYECNYKENLSRHRKTHLSSEERISFICHICDFETLYRKSYRMHMEMIHQIITAAKPKKAEFKCYHCPFETKYRVSMVRHLKLHMKGDTDVYKCTDCDFQTIHKSNFNAHVLRHKDPGSRQVYECQHCSHKTNYKPNLRDHLKLHMKKAIKTFKCDACEFETRYRARWRRHQKDHTGPGNSYNCAE